MHHFSRIWTTGQLPEDSTAAAAEILRCSSWCSCTGWTWRGLLLLNDQTSADGAFELAVLRLYGPERPASLAEERQHFPRRAAALVDIQAWTGKEPSAVLSAYEQLESLTVSWMDAEKLRNHLEKIHAEGADATVWERSTVILDRSERHRCEHCA